MKPQKSINIVTFVTLTIAAILFGGLSAQAASQTWTNAPADATWTNVHNWVVGTAVPGALNQTGNSVNNDTATFNSPIFGTIGSAANPIVPDDATINGDRSRTVGSIIFDTANCGAYVFSSPSPAAHPTASNPETGILNVCNGGSITINAAVANSQTFLIPLFIRLPSSTPGVYSFVNNATDPNVTLFINCATNESANSRGTVFTLGGSNTGTNTINSMSVGTTTTGVNGFSKIGTGKWILPFDNDFTNNTPVAINDGTLEIKNIQSLGHLNNNSVTVTSNGVLQVDGVTPIQNSIALQRNGTVRMNGSASLNTLNIGNTPGGITTPTLATTGSGDILTVGPVTNGISDAVLHVAGPGKVVLAQPGTYVGNWSIDAGITVISNAAALGLGAVSVGPGGTLDVSPLGATNWIPGSSAFGGSGTAASGSSAATITADPGATINLANKGVTVTFTPTSFSGDTTHPSFILSSGTLAVGATTFTINNASGTPLGVGTYRIAQQSSGSIVNSGGNVTLMTGSGTAFGTLGTIQISGGNIDLVVVAYTARNLSWKGGNPNAVWDTSTKNWWDGVQFTNFNTSDLALFDATGAANSTVSIPGTVVPTTTTVDTATTDYAFTGAGQIGGAASLTKMSLGTLTVSTVNSYLGGTTVSNGVLKIGVNNAIPAAGTVTINSAGTLDLNGLTNSIGGLAGSGTVDTTTGTGAGLLVGNNDENGSFFGAIQNTAGALSLTKVGLGAQTLNGASTYTGSTTVNNGILRIGNSSALGAETNALTVNTGATLDMGTDLTVGSLSGGAGLIANNSTASAVTLTVSQPVATIYNGNIQDGSGGGTVAVKILNGASLTFAGTANNFSGGTIVGSGSTFAIPNSPASVGGSVIASNGATLFLSGGSGTPGTPTNITTVDGATVTLNAGALGKIWGAQFVGSANTTNRVTAQMSFGGDTSLKNFSGVINMEQTGPLRFINIPTGGEGGGDAATIIWANIAATVVTRDPATVRLGQIMGGSLSGGIDTATGGGTDTYMIGGKGNDSVFSGFIRGLNNIVKVGAGTLTLAATTNVFTYIDPDLNTINVLIYTNVISYTGTTTISNGVLELIAPNTITNSPAINLAGSSAVLDLRNAGYATYDTNGVDVDNNFVITNSTIFTNSSIEIAGAHSLGGFGTIRGNILMDADSILNVGLPTGSLIVTSNAHLAGLVTMNINRDSSPSNSMLSANTFTIDGTAALIVTNISTSTLQNGETFQLFSQPVTFAGGVTLPTLGGSAFISNRLSLDGTLVVVNPVNTTPTNITVSASGGNITLSWPLDHTGWTLQVQTNTLATGLLTNDSAWFDVPGSSSVNTTNIPVDSSSGSVFYRLRL